MSNNEKQIRDALDKFISVFLPNLDCDGCTRLVSQLLDKVNV